MALARVLPLVQYAVRREGSRFAIALTPTVSCKTFWGFVRHDQREFIRVMREILHITEQNLGCRNYHLRVMPFTGAPTPAKRGQLSTPLEEGDALMPFVKAAGFYVCVFGDNERKGEPAEAEGLSELDAKIDYVDKSGKRVTLPVTNRDLTVFDGETARVCLDAQGLPVLVVVFKRFVRLQSECSDDEVLELWTLALQAVQERTGWVDDDLFQDIRLNAGTFQNVSHLHLKVWMNPGKFRECWKGHAGYEALSNWLNKSGQT